MKYFVFLMSLVVSAEVCASASAKKNVASELLAQANEVEAQAKKQADQLRAQAKRLQDIEQENTAKTPNLLIVVAASQSQLIENRIKQLEEPAPVQESMQPIYPIYPTSRGSW